MSATASSRGLSAFAKSFTPCHDQSIQGNNTAKGVVNETTARGIAALAPEYYYNSQAKGNLKTFTYSNTKAISASQLPSDQDIYEPKTSGKSKKRSARPRWGRQKKRAHDRFVEENAIAMAKDPQSQYPAKKPFRASSAPPQLYKGVHTTKPSAILARGAALIAARYTTTAPIWTPEMDPACILALNPRAPNWAPTLNPQAPNWVPALNPTAPDWVPALNSRAADWVPALDPRSPVIISSNLHPTASTYVHHHQVYPHGTTYPSYPIPNQPSAPAADNQQKEKLRLHMEQQERARGFDESDDDIFIPNIKY
ncbi:hypothetical protein F5Y04DRAFT_281742 [Hypomontagnella monticulosa]|nr:hypothetical protein F5Y04DRAFT_281742 [Hypomontagnella monticulosa]